MVLGLAFKADTDDKRDSLAHKLNRPLERELGDVAATIRTWPRRRSPSTTRVRDADAVVITTNHSEFRGRKVLAAIADHVTRIRFPQIAGIQRSCRGRVLWHAHA